MAPRKDEQRMNRRGQRGIRKPRESVARRREIAYPTAADRIGKRNPAATMPPPPAPSGMPLDPEGYYARLGVEPWSGPDDHHRRLSPQGAPGASRCAGDRRCRCLHGTEAGLRRADPPRTAGRLRPLGAAAGQAVAAEQEPGEIGADAVSRHGRPAAPAIRGCAICPPPSGLAWRRS